MATVGGTTVSYLYGVVPDLAQSVKVIERPGVNGYLAIKSGTRSPTFTMRIVHFAADDAAVTTLLTALLLLQGTVITIADDFAVSTTNVLVVAFGEPRKKAVLTNAGATRQVEIEMQCLRVGA